MKRFLSFIVLAVLVVTLLPLQAMSETWYVYTANGKTLNLRDPYTNRVIGHIPYGTALEPDSNLSTQTAAYVTYNGVTGFAQWRFLQKDPPKPLAGVQTPAPVAVAPAIEAPNSKSGNIIYQGSGYEITAHGAYIQYANKKNRGEGQKYETLFVNAEDNIVITPDVPKGKKIDYWVINGVRYDFSTTVKYLRMTDADDNFDFEVVYTKSVSQTLISPEDIQLARNDDIKEIQTRHAKLSHMTEQLKRGGGWMDSFDFTQDYINKATNRIEPGGQITAQVKATVGKNQKVRGWKFNETKLYPSATINYFTVRTLNTSMTYEPIFKSVATVTDPPTQRQPPVEVPAFYRVSCINCTFSGGGHTNATSGIVPAGTKITVTNKSGSTEVSEWQVNGSTLYRSVSIGGKKGQKLKVRNTSNTITRTINKDTTIRCLGIIN